MRYQSKSKIPSPLDNSVVDIGTFMRVMGIAAPDNITNGGGSPSLVRLPIAMIIPQAKADNGASNDPTEATPSVAKSDAFNFPRRNQLDRTMPTVADTDNRSNF
jgi:hypothetical protein